MRKVLKKGGGYLIKDDSQPIQIKDAIMRTLFPTVSLVEIRQEIIEVVDVIFFTVTLF
jgi:hypothetical protein